MENWASIRVSHLISVNIVMTNGFIPFRRDEERIDLCRRDAADAPIEGTVQVTIIYEFVLLRNRI